MGSLNLSAEQSVGPHVGGMFAPPLTPEKLEEYKVLAVSAPPQVGEAMSKLIAMVEEFRKTPRSKLKGTPHGVGPALGVDGELRPAPMVVKLEQAEIDRMFDHIPWAEELEMFNDLFEKIDAEADSRNGSKWQAWNIAVNQAITSRHFPDLVALQAMNEAWKLCEKFPGQFPELEAWVLEHKPKADACVKEIIKTVNSKTSADVATPTVEPVPLRVACKHLLWYAVELYKDREPITNDQLRA